MPDQTPGHPTDPHPEAPRRSSLQRRICNILTFIGLLGIILWGGQTILYSREPSVDTITSLPGDPESVIEDTLPNTEEDFTLPQPLPEPIAAPPADTLEANTVETDTLPHHFGDTPINPQPDTLHLPDADHTPKEVLREIPDTTAQN